MQSILEVVADNAICIVAPAICRFICTFCHCLTLLCIKYMHLNTHNIDFVTTMPAIF